MNGWEVNATAGSARGESSFVTALRVAGVEPDETDADAKGNDASAAESRDGEEAEGRSNALATITPFSATTS